MRFALPLIVMMGLILLGVLLPRLKAEARPMGTPWATENSFQNLVYGASTSVDVQNILGPPDEILKTEQIYPLIENFLYYEEGKKEGPASILVFENGLLVGLHYKSPEGQMVDLTYFLQDNGDRMVNAPLLEGYRRYSPVFPFTSWY